MSYLLDTHSFLWFVNDDSQLSQTANQTIQTSKNVYISMASIWEVGININLAN